jgi:heme/copper-type cytochrome/quinol oxidase subunit 4
MHIKDLAKPHIYLPILFGVSIGAVLYALGENDDAPGLALIGFVLAIVLIFVGVYNAVSSLKKNLVVALACFCLSLSGIITTVVLYLDGEFNDTPGYMIFAGIIIIGLILVGIKSLRGKK